MYSSSYIMSSKLVVSNIFCSFILDLFIIFAYCTVFLSYFHKNEMGWPRTIFKFKHEPLKYIKVGSGAMECKHPLLAGQTRRVLFVAIRNNKKHVSNLVNNYGLTVWKTSVTTLPSGRLYLLKRSLYRP